MSQWETILDQQSHISPVRFIPHKDHSAEWVEDMFRTYSSSDAFQQSQQVPLMNSSTAHTMTTLQLKKKRSSWLYRLGKSSIISIIIIVIAGCSLSKHCDTFVKHDRTTIHHHNNVDTLCQYLHLLNADQITKAATETILQNPVLKPATSYALSGYRWVESTNLSEASKQIKQYSQKKLNDHYIPLLKSLYQSYVSDVITRLIDDYKQQLKEYIESGSSKSLSSDGQWVMKEKQDSKKDRIRQTAKRIVDYLDEKSRKSAMRGMHKEEAKEKAREIIQNLIQNGNHDKTIIGDNFHTDSNTISNEADLHSLVAKEIHSILEYAAAEKAQLIHQLNLIQAQIKEAPSSTLANDYNDDKRDDEAGKDDLQQKQRYFVFALKNEVEVLRATAEDNIRKRTKLSSERVGTLMQKHTDNSIVQQHIIENIQSTQKLALKDLRQTYVQLYETKKQIDQQLLVQQKEQ
ncbi:hypothetical protein BDF20DRAFT_890769 [Mycotypha africana]|uniref:uncharacterized protein n=1 Tax=Mycotypha africana TaxID=64632 RepID=UPI0023004B61|nr:uncharacterized protein BDF20DRAFT_890769 [Mycotypha africana]KAI8970355.1 hypothetical protein BDF20DRAFT_890769 [Mycotypha africana]